MAQGQKYLHRAEHLLSPKEQLLFSSRVLVAVAVVTLRTVLVEDLENIYYAILWLLLREIHIPLRLVLVGLEGLRRLVTVELVGLLLLDRF
jgi:hypothetical protein